MLIFDQIIIVTEIHESASRGKKCCKPKRIPSLSRHEYMNMKHKAVTVK